MPGYRPTAKPRRKPGQDARQAPTTPPTVAELVAKATEDRNISKGNPGDVSVQLGFPTSHGTNGDEPQRAHLELTDRPSNTVVADLYLTAEQFMGLMSGSTAHATGAFVVRKPGRIGFRAENASVQVPYGAERNGEARAMEIAAEFMATGWETTEVRRTNSGHLVVARRWVPIEDASA